MVGAGRGDLLGEPVAASRERGELLVDLAQQAAQRRRRAVRRGGGLQRRCGVGARGAGAARRSRRAASHAPNPPGRGDRGAVVDDEDVGHGPLEEGAVVADDDHGARPVLEDVLEHSQRVEVEVVRRLVEQQHVGTGAQREHELQPPPLAARQQADGSPLGVGVEPEALEEAGVLPVRLAGRPATAWSTRIAGSRSMPRWWNAPSDHGRADLPGPLGRAQRAGDDVEERRLAGAVRADDAEPLAGVEPPRAPAAVTADDAPGGKAFHPF